MTARIASALVVVCIALATSACDQGRERLPNTTVHLVNVAPNFIGLDFRRERTQGVTLDFKGAGGPLIYDEDTYDFSIDTIVAEGVSLDARTFAKHVVSGTEYTFVLMQVGAGVEESILEYTPLPAASTEAQVLALHAAENLPPMSVHLVPQGTDVTGLVPWGTIGFRETLPARTFTAGSYEVAITDPANPATVLFKSAPIALTAPLSSVIVLVPENGQTSAPFSVAFLQQDVLTVLYDVNSQGALRVINAADDRAPRDVAVASQFSPPLFAAVPFAEPTAYAPVPVSSSLKLDATPPGNPGVLELDAAIATFAARTHTTFISGTAGTLTQVLTVDDRRRIPSIAAVSFYNAARQVPDGVDVFLTPPGVGPAGFFPVVSLGAPAVNAGVRVPPATYDLTVRQSGTTTVVAGPTPVTLESAGLYGVVIVNGAAPPAAELVFIEDFQ